MIKSLLYKSLFLVLLLISSCKTEGIKNDTQKDNKSSFSKKKSDFFQKSLKEDLNESDLKPTKIIDQKIISNQIKINYFKKGDGEIVFENDVLKINYEVYLEDGTFIDGNKLLKKPWLPFLVGFEMQERAVPRHDYEIVDKDGNSIGIVTSGTMSPSMSVGIGLGYVSTEHSTVDSVIFI